MVLSLLPSLPPPPFPPSLPKPLFLHSLPAPLVLLLHRCSSVAATTAPAAAAAAAAASAPTAAAASAPNAARNAAPAAANRLKRFRFKEAADLLLLKAMTEASGHLAEWGEREGKHAEALQLFLRAAPPGSFSGHQKPTAKSLGDRLRRILADRKDQVKADEAASGIIEEYGERETLLDDMLLEIKEKDEADRAAKDETKEKEKRLLEAGEQIRENVIRRRTRDSTTPSPSPPRAPFREQRSESDDESMQMLKEDMDNRRKNDATRLELEQRRMVMEEKRMEREETRFMETEETTRRRLLLDKKRGEVDIEERKQSIQERAKMIEVLAGLVQKLG